MPTTPEFGVKEVMVGVLVTMKSDSAVWPLAVTAILPVVAAAGTVVLSVVVVAFVIVAAVPLNFTSDSVALKFTPEMVTTVPTSPNAGLTEVIDTTSLGAGSSFWQDTRKKNKKDIRPAMKRPDDINLI